MMSTTYGRGVKQCKRGHPIDSEPCYLCRQEDQDQSKRDEALIQQLRRLKEQGRLDFLE